ncbi:MAG: hypothetical protein F4X11_12840 [Acidobacteria bacterium]|nr:hypothetical protein [Acidobacteriota bacterium]
MRDQLSVRLPHELNAAVAERAKRDARRPSDVVRLALQAYLRESDSDGPGRPDRAREGGGTPAWGDSGSPATERTILLRRVPEELYRALKERAARERLSVSGYVLDILARRQFRERLQSRPRVNLSVPAADIVREGRDSR